MATSYMINPPGLDITANKQYLTQDGHPWQRMMVEYQNNRCPAAEWCDELLKMQGD